MEVDNDRWLVICRPAVYCILSVDLLSTFYSNFQTTESIEDGRMNDVSWDSALSDCFLSRSRRLLANSEEWGGGGWERECSPSLRGNNDARDVILGTKLVPNLPTATLTLALFLWWSDVCTLGACALTFLRILALLTHAYVGSNAVVWL